MSLGKSGLGTTDLDTEHPRDNLKRRAVSNVVVSVSAQGASFVLYAVSVVVLMRIFCQRISV
jgi:hypothetical protein